MEHYWRVGILLGWAAILGGLVLWDGVKDIGILMVIMVGTLSFVSFSIVKMHPNKWYLPCMEKYNWGGKLGTCPKCGHQTYLWFLF